MNKERPNLHFVKENIYLYHIIISLFPLSIYAFYKNGILPFMNHDISAFQVIRPILFPLTGFLVGALVDYLIWWKSDSDTIWKNTSLYGLLITMTLPINANILLVAVLLFLVLFLFRKILYKMNPVIWGITILGTIFHVMGGVSFANGSELNHSLLYSMLDILFGRSVGGICTTSIFWSILSFIYLCFDPYYKKEIPISILISYAITAIAFEGFLPSGDLLKTLLNSSVVFGSIWIASEMKYSPYMETAKICYGIGIGILAFLLTRFISNPLGIYWSITLFSLLVPFLNQFAIKLEEKKTTFVESPKLKTGK